VVDTRRLRCYRHDEKFYLCDSFCAPARAREITIDIRKGVSRIPKKKKAAKKKGGKKGRK